MAAIVRRKEGRAEPTLYVSQATAKIRFDGIFVRISVQNYEVVLSPAEVAEAMRQATGAAAAPADGEG